MEKTIENWLQYEPRRVKPNIGHSMYPLTTDTIFTRMKIQLPPHFIKNKKVLDLGCSIPFNEIWCKNYDAELYHGVEFFKSLTDIGNSLVQHPNKIINDTIEHFVVNNDLSCYDTIIIQSSLNTVKDFICVFEKICNSKANIIFESTKLNIVSDDPIIKLAPAGAHNTDKEYETIEVQNFYPNLQAISVLFESNSYTVNDFPNKIMETKLPNWSKYKFCCWGEPTNIKKYQYLKNVKYQ